MLVDDAIDDDIGRDIPKLWIASATARGMQQRSVQELVDKHPQAFGASEGCHETGIEIDSLPVCGCSRHSLGDDLFGEKRQRRKKRRDASQLKEQEGAGIIPFLRWRIDLHGRITGHLGVCGRPPEFL